MNIKNFQQIHLTGIGGISMSSIAHILHSQHHIITGSDNTHNPNIDTLIQKGINVHIGHHAPFIHQADLIIHSSAIPAKDPDLTLAKTLDKPIIERSVFLGLLASNYRNIIAVSGTHGKTTTTAMLDHIFKTAQLHPTTHIGGILRDTHTNYTLGSTQYFITEACEYRHNLIHLHPHTSIITNIECEHMDCYHDLNELISTFQQFTRQTRDLIIINGDSLHTTDFASTKGQQILTFGLLNHNMCYADNIQIFPDHCTFQCFYQKQNLGEIRLNLLGEHNIANALASILTSINYNIPFSTIQSALSTFHGIHRRFDIILEHPYHIIHDYAHHPTEIIHTIDTALHLNSGKLHTVFQPHTYSRTLTLMPQFSTAFSNTHYLYILPTYPSREMPILGGDAIDLFYNVLPHTPNTTYCPHPEALYHYLYHSITPGDTILFLGAGSIDTIATQYSSILRLHSP